MFIKNVAFDNVKQNDEPETSNISSLMSTKLFLGHE